LIKIKNVFLRMKEFFFKSKYVAPFALLAVLLFFLAPAVVFQNLFSPVSSFPDKRLILITPGMNTESIGLLLEKKGIIRSGKGFAFYAKLTGKAEKLRAGEYELDRAKTTPAILEEILKGRVKLYPITVPEGLTLVETARLMEKNGFGHEASIISAASDPEMLEAFGIKNRNAEGYLFPDTYRFNRDVTGREIVRQMISTFFKKVEPLKLKYQSRSTLSFEQIITLASIIEKETANRREYWLISAVYHNRLKKGMKLQADPTVIYALPDFNGNIRRKDLGYDSPYNTYVYSGLPPGPISNPGLKAIEAAYSPAEEDFLYFVAMKAGGAHYFSRTYNEHINAVRKYQLRRRR